MLSGENSILNQAGSARDLTGEKNIAEKVQIAYMGALANGTGSFDRGKFVEELDKMFGAEKYTLSTDGATITIDEKDYDTGLPGKWSNAEKTAMTSNNITELTGDDITNNNLKDTTKIKAENNAQIPIPIDAEYVEGKESTGVVIKYKKSEFVWVPVPDAIYDSTKDENIPKASATGSLTNTNHTYTPMAINTGTTAEPVYKGLLYSYNATNGAYLKYAGASQYQGTASQSQYREPAYLSGSNYDDNTTFGGLFTDSDLQTSYNSMVISVAKYGGFFIGRYETSYNGTDVASVENVLPMSAATTSGDRWYGMYDKQSKFTTSSDKMVSSMIWGSQYDAMLNWTLTGTDSEHITASSYGNHQGGAVECGSYNNGSDKINNIYDLEGNLFEWTQEAYGIGHRGYRGGYYWGTNVPSYRYYCSPSNSNSFNIYGSRLSLYIK